jgi:integrase
MGTGQIKIRRDEQKRHPGGTYLAQDRKDRSGDFDPAPPGPWSPTQTVAAHEAITIAATTRGTRWSVSGFNSTFIKAIAKLEREGKVGAGLTFHGLRHTVGTLLIEAGVNLGTVRRWLGQKTLAMAIHYSETADMSKQMNDALKKFDPLGSKTRTKVSNGAKKVSNKSK